MLLIRPKDHPYCYEELLQRPCMKCLYEYLQTDLLKSNVHYRSYITHGYGHTYMCIGISYVFLSHAAGKFSVESRWRACQPDNIGGPEITDCHLSGPSVLLEWNMEQAEFSYFNLSAAVREKHFNVNIFSSHSCCVLKLWPWLPALRRIFSNQGDRTGNSIHLQCVPFTSVSSLFNKT